jgi:hypothetical protein
MSYPHLDCHVHVGGALAAGVGHLCRSYHGRLSAVAAIDVKSAPLIAASIFLDAANVFQLFLPLFGRSRDWAAA